MNSNNEEAGGGGEGEQLRELARAFINRHEPAELAAFDVVWARFQAAAEDGLLQAPRRPEGLGFDPDEERLLSVWVSCVVLLASQKLRTRLGEGPAAAASEFQSVVTSLGGNAAIVQKLTEEIGPGLIRILETGEARQKKAVKLGSSSGGAQPLGRKSRELWLADVLTKEMIESGDTRPKVLGPRPLKEVKALPEIVNSRFELDIDESSDEGILMCPSPSGPEQMVPWVRFSDKSGMLLDVVLTALSENVFRVDREQLFEKLGVAHENSDGALGQKRGVWRTLQGALGGMLTRLAQPDKKGGFELRARVSYCWIRRENGERRFPAR